jgi:hypothetical protein
MFSVDASDCRRLAAEFGKLGRAGAHAADTALAAGAKTLETAWKANAAATSGEHGKHYPASIDHERTFSLGAIEYEIGPNPGKPQGGMQFEEGSVNQPPHLDGAKAADATLPAIEKQVADSVFKLMGF